MITDCVFVFSDQKLITSSKDSFVKIWDIESQHCVQTVVGHRNEVWSIDVNKEQTRLVTASQDNKIRVWSLNPQEFSLLPLKLIEQKEQSTNEEVVIHQDNQIDDALEVLQQPEEILVKLIGSFDRQSRERAMKLRYNQKNTL